MNRAKQRHPALNRKDMPHILSDLARYALWALLMFTPLARASVQNWAISVIHIITLFALTTFLLDKSLSMKWKWIRTPLDKPILGLLVLTTLSTIFSMHQPTSLWSLILFINHIVIFYLVIHTVRTRSQLRQIIYIIMGMAAFLSVFGLFKLSGMNPFPWWEYADLSKNADRMTATFGNPDHLAGYMEMAGLLVLGLFLTGFRYLNSFFMIFLIFLTTISLIFSLSRGAWIGTFTGLIFMIPVLLTSRYFKKKKLTAALAIGFLVVMLVVLTSTPVVERIRTFEQKENMPSFSGRVTVWKGILEMIEDHPLVGTGPGMFATVFTQYEPPGQKTRYFMGHNDYLHFISEIGIPLVPVILWMMVCFYKTGLEKLRNRSRLVRGTTLGGMAGVTAILVHGIGDFNLHIPANALFFTILAALVVGPLPAFKRVSPMRPVRIRKSEPGKHI